MFAMFSPDYVINYALGLLPTWVPWAVAGFGFALFILVHMLGKLIPLIYRFIVTIVCFCIFGLGFWLEGRQNILIEGKHEVEKVVEKQVLVTKVVVEKYKEQVKKDEEVHEQIISQINDKDDHMCSVPESFVRLHDSAAKNTVPGPSTGTDGAASGIALSEVERTIADNYSAYNKLADQLRSLQEWVTEEKKANP